jgi:hypothetical protein
LSNVVWSPESVPAADLAVRVRNLGDTLIVALSLEEPVELTDVAAFIWRLIDGSRPVKTIVARVAAAYGIDYATAAEDVVEFLGQLADGDLIEATDRGQFR